MKPLFMENTKIDPTRTAGEVTSELVRAGAISINTEYKAGKVCGLRWIMRVAGNDTLFDMPVRVDPIYQLLKKRSAGNSQFDAAKTMLKAERIAWRQLLRWVQAQNAMIETNMVQAAEVYLPYMVVHASGQTLFQKLSDSQFKMLPAPEQAT